MIFSITPFETSNIFLLSALLFVAGIVEDVLDTWVTFTVVKRQTVATCIITFFGIILEFTVFLSFISNLDKFPVIIAYAFGATVGTAMVIEFQKRAKRKKRAEDKVRRQIRAARKKRQEQKEDAKKARLLEAKNVKRISEKTVLVAPKKQATPIKVVEIKAVKPEQKVDKKVRKEIKSDEETPSLGKSDPVKPSA